MLINKNLHGPCIYLQGMTEYTALVKDDSNYSTYLLRLFSLRILAVRADVSFHLPL